MAFSDAAELTHRDPAGYYIYSLEATASARRRRCSLISTSPTASRGFENRRDQHGGGRKRHVRQQFRPARAWLRAARRASEDSTRRKYGLAPKERMPTLDDQAARASNYSRVDADWIDFEATVSTSADQIALAPGYLQREWTEERPALLPLQDGRADPGFLLLPVGALGGRTRPAGKCLHGRCAIEVYYHPGHAYNVDRMIDAMKKSLDYFTDELRAVPASPGADPRVPALRELRAGVSQHDPVFRSRSASSPTCDKDRGHRLSVLRDRARSRAPVVGAPGDRRQRAGRDACSSETLAQYSALMVMEKEYGARADAASSSSTSSTAI